jgi:hypothetical protein
MVVHIGRSEFARLVSSWAGKPLSIFFGVLLSKLSDTKPIKEVPLFDRDMGPEEGEVAHLGVSCD